MAGHPYIQPAWAVTYRTSEFPVESPTHELHVSVIKRKLMMMRRRRPGGAWSHPADQDAGPVWGNNPVKDDRSNFTQSRPLQGDIGPHVLRTPVLLSEA